MEALRQNPGSDELCRALAEARLQLHPPDPLIPAGLQLARIYLEEGRIDLAWPLLEYTHMAFPENIELGFELAEVSVAAGYIARGADLYRRVAHLCLDSQQIEMAMKAFFLLDLLKQD